MPLQPINPTAIAPLAGRHWPRVMVALVVAGLCCFSICYALKVDLRLRLRQSERLLEDLPALDAQRFAEVCNSFLTPRGVRFLIAQMYAEGGSRRDGAFANLVSISGALAGKRGLSGGEAELKRLIDGSGLYEKGEDYCSSAPSESVRILCAAKFREYQARAASAPFDVWVARYNGAPGMFTADVRIYTNHLAAILDGRRRRGACPLLRIRAEDGIGADVLLPIVGQGISAGLTNINILLRQDLGKELDMFRQRLEAPSYPSYGASVGTSMISDTSSGSAHGKMNRNSPPH